MIHAETFAQHRGLLFTIAYEIVGTAADAEDAVQDAYLSWASTDLTHVRDARAFLVRITTRRALDVLRSQRRRREEYIGPWLPEPVITTEDSDLSDSVTMAMLLIFETLSPIERAVFVLREVFDYPYDEVAAAVGKPTATVRQIAHRAREHVQARRPRFSTDPQAAAMTALSFLAAVQEGNIGAAVDLLAPDAVVISDGGGIVSAARRPVHGADRVARLLAGLFRRGAMSGKEIGVEFVTCNGVPGVLATEDGERALCALMEIIDGRVQSLYLMRNPHKLARIGATPQLTRSPDTMDRS